MERDFRNHKYENILEVGAGQGQHFEYVKCEFGSYTQTDVRDFSMDSTKRSDKVSFMQADAQNLTQFHEDQFDRLIATCVLAHLPDPEKALNEWRRVTSKDSGIITIYLPCEPSILLRTAQMLSTKRKTRKLGINYDLMHYREHRNYYFFLRALLLDIFCNDRIRVVGFPSKFLPFDFNLYMVYQIELVRRARKRNDG
jgi:phosphatidylethanolamine/phosphatidyl-N-methylethanolamine N-methyltransferase